MAHEDVDATAHDHRSPAALERPGGVGIFVVLGVAILNDAVGSPEWLRAWIVTAVLLVVAGVAIFARVYGTSRPTFDSDRDRYRVAALAVLLVGLLVVVYQSRSPGYGFGGGRDVSAALVFLALSAVCVLSGDPREYSSLQWGVLSSVLLVVGIFFLHSLSVPAASVRSRHPIWAGFVMAVGLVVLPQYVSRAAFLWAVTRVGAVLVVLTLPMYVLGEYSLLGLSFQFNEAYQNTGWELEKLATRSFFHHRNAFAIVVFAGLVSAVAEFHWTAVRTASRKALRLPALLLALNGLGLLLSFGRALWVITPLAVGVYLAYAFYGWRAVPVAVGGGFLYLFAGIATVQSGLVPLPEGTPTRTHRWYPAIAAIVDKPSLLGEGLIDPGKFYAAYQGGAEYSPHNSYLTMVIRAGFLGGLAYLATVAVSLFAGLEETGDVDVEARVGVLSLGVGFAAHQLFEAYTLFNWGSSTVLAVLSLGLLAFGGVATGATTRSPARAAS